MWAGQSNATTNILKVCDDKKVIRSSLTAEFEDKPFDEGTFRYCYEGIIKQGKRQAYPNDFPSGRCVVKVFKDHNRSDSWLNETDNSLFSRKMANLFNSNKFSEGLYKIYFVSPYIAHLDEYAGFKLFGLFNIRNDDAKEKIKKNKVLMIEPFLTGNYIKFVSNTNWTNPEIESKTIPAFMHFTWVISKGTAIVSDVQGVIKDGCFLLTDPAVQSVNKSYGASDLGVFGLIQFLAKHEHNEYCNFLPWPNLQIMNILKATYQRTFRGTSFSFQFNICQNGRDAYLKICHSIFN